tara:strand:- start:3364 stop:3741 length:378 start_codon:yes stop_codon:yes gene_type:complete
MKTAKKILSAFDRQIKNDIGFWIRNRPSRWRYLLPEKFIKPFLKYIEKRGGKNFVLKISLIFSLIVVGFIPTLNFIWSNIFRVWLILLFIPIVYWTFAIISIYARVLNLVFSEFIKPFLKNLIDR